MKRILIITMLLLLCSCGGGSNQTSKLIIDVAGTSKVKISCSDSIDENINVNGFYSNTFEFPVGSKLNLKWETDPKSTDDVIVQIVSQGKAVREGRGKNGEIIYDVETQCFINSLERRRK